MTTFQESPASEETGLPDGPRLHVLDTLTAADVMSSDPILVSEDESVVMAAYLMRQADVHHLPVMRGGRVVGLLDDIGLAACMTRLTWDELRHPVHRVMHRDVVRVRPTAGLRSVAEHLGYSRSGMVVVTADCGLVGVITASDVVAAVARWLQSSTEAPVD